MKLSTAARRYPLITFFILAYAWTWLCWFTAVAATGTPSGGREVLLVIGQFGPFAAAVCVAGLHGGRRAVRELWARFGRWRMGLTWLAVSLLLLPTILLVAILLHAAQRGALHSVRFQGSWATLPIHFVYTLLLAGPLAEEPGWRGLALPHLQRRYGPALSSVVLGLVEGAWHLPLWWINPSPMPLAVFLVTAVLLAYVFTWVFNHTRGSLPAALILHASLNTAGARLPEAPAHGAWVVCLLVVVLAVVVLDRDFHRAPAEALVHSWPFAAEDTVVKGTSSA